MIDGRKVLGVIVARGGSKGLPGKNLLDVGGRPMVVWSVIAGQASRYVDRLILSSDDENIISAVRMAGCEVPFSRPPHLATDTASLQDVLIHTLDTLDEIFDYVVLLQSTSPLRHGHDIDRALEICEQTGAPACVSVTTPTKSPYWMYHVEDGGRMSRLLTHPVETSFRQNLPDTYVLNGAVYVAHTEWFRENRTFLSEETRAFIMPPERSVDIDARHDWIYACALMSDSNKKI